MKNAKEELPQRIRFLRELQGYSQESIAACLGISQQAYQKMESGRCRICQDRLREIANFLGVDSWQLECMNKGELLAIYEKREDKFNRERLIKEIINIQSEIDDLKKRNDKLLRTLEN